MKNAATGMQQSAQTSNAVRSVPFLYAKQPLLYKRSNSPHSPSGPSGPGAPEQKKRGNVGEEGAAESQNKEHQRGTYALHGKFGPHHCVFALSRMQLALLVTRQL